MIRKDWSVKTEILKRVNKEAEVEVEIPQPKLPPYEKVEMVWTETSKEAFAKAIRYFSI